MSLLSAVFLICIYLLCPFTAQCASQGWQPGFRTNGLWLQEENIRLDYNIWYPATRQPGKHNFPPWQVVGSLNAPPVRGSFPLLVLSHPSPANRFFFSSLAGWLAAKGFIVAAPTHSRDNLDNMDDLHTWEQLKNRVAEISALLTAIINEPLFSESLDKDKVGYIGFGAGVGAGLLLGGCLPECPPMANSSESPKSARNGIASSHGTLVAACANFPLKKSLANPKIGAMALIAPDCQDFFGENSFKYFYPKTLLIAVGSDLKLPNANQAEQLGRKLGGKALFLDLPGTDPAGLQDKCPQALAQELPELCLSINDADRGKIRRELEKTLLSFFQQFLIQNPTQIPNPPDLTPPPPKNENRETPVRNRGKRKR